MFNPKPEFFFVFFVTAYQNCEYVSSKKFTIELAYQMADDYESENQLSWSCTGDTADIYKNV